MFENREPALAESDSNVTATVKVGDNGLMSVNLKFKFSMVLSTFDHRDYVTRKLEQIKAQSIFDECEFIFIDAQSPGEERDLIHPETERYPNIRLLALEKRISLYAAWNLGWNEARAPYICYSNMDDVMHPMLLETVLAEMTVNGLDLCTVLSVCQPISEYLNNFDPKRLRHYPLTRRPGGPFTAWRKTLKEECGQFDERFFMVGDKEFWSRMIRLGVKWDLIPRILYLFTKDPSSLGKQSADDPRKASDNERINSSPHPIQWPKAMKRKVQVAALKRALRFGKVEHNLVVSQAVLDQFETHELP